VSEETRDTAGPVDLEALALHVIRFSGELERAWSDALDAAVMKQAEGELNTELSSFVTAMNGALQETDAKLLAADIDPKIYTWPYDPRVFKSLDKSSEPEVRRSQLVVAQMVALREVLEAFKALQEPSGEEVDLITGSRTEWFEAGAFSLFRNRAMLLLPRPPPPSPAGVWTSSWIAGSSPSACSPSRRWSEALAAFLTTATCSVKSGCARYEASAERRADRALTCLIFKQKN
jgi:hypothetical protein